MKKGSPSVKTIWFDLGNVILNFDFSHAYSRISKYTDWDKARIREYFVSHPALEADLDEGRAPAVVLYRRLVRDLRLKGLRFSAFKNIWNRIFWPNRPVIALIRRLKKNGYRLILVSNTNRLHYDHIRLSYPVLKLFAKHVLSFRVKARKPGRRIYETALRFSRGKGREIFYTDDRAEMTTAARANHDVNAHTYRNVRELVDDMRLLGIRVS